MKATALQHSCPLGRALSLLSGRWKSSLLCALIEEHPAPIRFMELQRIAGRKAGMPAALSRKVLSHELKELEQDGLVHRAPGPLQRANPPFDIRYGLTPWGARLGPVFHALERWSETIDRVAEGATTGPS